MEYFPTQGIATMDLLYDFCIAEVNLNHVVIGSPPHAIWADVT